MVLMWDMVLSLTRGACVVVVQGEPWLYEQGVANSPSVTAHIPRGTREPCDQLSRRHLNVFHVDDVLAVSLPLSDCLRCRCGHLLLSLPMARSTRSRSGTSMPCFVARSSSSPTRSSMRAFTLTVRSSFMSFTVCPFRHPRYPKRATTVPRTSADTTTDDCRGNDQTHDTTHRRRHEQVCRSIRDAISTSRYPVGSPDKLFRRGWGWWGSMNQIFVSNTFQLDLSKRLCIFSAQLACRPSFSSVSPMRLSVHSGHIQVARPMTRARV